MDKPFFNIDYDAGEKLYKVMNLTETNSGVSQRLISKTDAKGNIHSIILVVIHRDDKVIHKSKAMETLPEGISLEQFTSTIELWTKHWKEGNENRSVTINSFEGLTKEQTMNRLREFDWLVNPEGKGESNEN